MPYHIGGDEDFDWNMLYTAGKWMYNCSSCSGTFQLKEVVVDHILPCGSFLNEHDWATFGPNLFCNKSNLQVWGENNAKSYLGR